MKRSRNHKRLREKVRLLDKVQKLQVNIKHAYSQTIYGDDDGFFDELLDNYDTIVPFDRPDMYFTCNDTVFGIEHFQFDSYKKIKGKGSAGARDANFAHEEMRDEARKVNFREAVSRKIQTEMSATFYEDNLISTFNHHYAQIDAYKESLSNEVSNAKDYKICFYIEDATPAGNYFATNEGLHFLEPFSISSFTQSLKTAYNLDYIVFYMMDYNYFRRLKLFQNSAENRKLLTDFYDVNKHHFVDYEYETILG